MVAPRKAAFLGTVFFVVFFANVILAKFLRDNLSFFQHLFKFRQRLQAAADRDVYDYGKYYSSMNHDGSWGELYGLRPATHPKVRRSNKEYVENVKKRGDRSDKHHTEVELSKQGPPVEAPTPKQLTRLRRQRHLMIFKKHRRAWRNSALEQSAVQPQPRVEKSAYDQHPGQSPTDHALGAKHVPLQLQPSEISSTSTSAPGTASSAASTPLHAAGKSRMSDSPARSTSRPLPAKAPVEEAGDGEPAAGEDSGGGGEGRTHSEGASTGARRGARSALPEGYHGAEAPARNRRRELKEWEQFHRRPAKRGKRNDGLHPFFFLPKFCNCRTPREPSDECYFYTDADENECRRHGCPAPDYICVPGPPTGITCVLQEVHQKVVPTGRDTCKTIDVVNFRYVPFSAS